MVQLDFQVQVQGPFESVWNYFSNFQNINDWDPNTKSCKVIKKNGDQIGSIYEIVSSFNGKQSIVTYQTKSYNRSTDQGHINLYGKNARITADDHIICKRKGPNSTIVIYKADICLRCYLCFLTPFIKDALNQIAVDAKQGCIKKGIQKWGKAK